MNIVPMILMMLLAAGPIRPDAPASIGGVVVIGQTNSPASDVVVRLIPFADEASLVPKLALSTNEPWRRGVEVDKTGRFVFEKVPAGNYRVEVNRTSRFVRISNEFPGTNLGIPVNVNPGESIRDVRIELTPAASISGRILDHKGKPAEGVQVAALSATYENGRRVFNSMRGALVARAVTNRRGEYRIEGLLPGQYFLSANFPLGLAGYGSTGLNTSGQANWCDANVLPGPSTFGEGTVWLAQTQKAISSFFPGVRNSAEATAIDVHASAQIHGADFKIDGSADTRNTSIKGAVVEAGSAKRAKNVEVWITPLDGGLDTCLIQAKNGSFETVGMRPGTYAVSANIEDPARMAGRTIVDTTQKGARGLTITVTPLFHVRGRIMVEGNSTDKPELDLSQFFVNLQPDPAVNSARLTFAPVSPDGTFDIQSLMGWDYRVTLRSPQQSAYIQSIRLGGVDVLNEAFHLDSPPSSDLEIVIRRDVGTVSGVAKLTPHPLHVVLVPDSTRRNRRDLYRIASPDEKGAFEMVGLPPGDYRLFAWEHVLDGAWMDPEFLRLYENQGIPVRITAGQTAPVTVKPLAPWK